MADTDILAMPQIAASQDNKSTTHNEALKILDAVVQLSVIDRDLATPPGSPTNGDRYIVATSPTGDWSTATAGDIAVRVGGAWEFYTPLEGWTAWVQDEDARVSWDGSAWVSDTSLPANAVLSDTTTMISVGYAQTSYDAGTQSSGTLTLDEANGSMQHYVNGGAHTLAPPTNDTSLHIQMTNNASAGAVTTSSFTVVTGDTLTTTDGDDFFLVISKNNGFSHLHVVALQ